MFSYRNYKLSGESKSSPTISIGEDLLLLLSMTPDLVWSSHAPQTVNHVLDENPDFYTDSSYCNAINQPTVLKKDNSSCYQRNSSTSSTSQLCFYHEKYGKKAKKCYGPCSFQSHLQMGNGSTGRRR